MKVKMVPQSHNNRSIVPDKGTRTRQRGEIKSTLTPTMDPELTSFNSYASHTLVQSLKNNQNFYNLLFLDIFQILKT